MPTLHQYASLAPFRHSLPALRVLGAGPDLAPVAELVEQFLGEQSRPATQRSYRQSLLSLFASAEVHDPSHLTTAHIVSWATAPTTSGRPRANNSVRSRANAAAGFLGWCRDHGIPAPLPGALKAVKRSHPPIYGKAQSANPARFLTYEEAGKLIRAAQIRRADPIAALREELICRLGLTGMRCAEIGALSWNDLDLTGETPLLRWTGKGNRPRRVEPPAGLLHALARWSALHADATGRRPKGDDRIICRTQNRSGSVLFGQPLSPVSGSRTIWQVITDLAKSAGLGHVAPHDLRRSAAAILHRDKDENGRHRFDLLDIQQILGHADPAITMKCYLMPMETETLTAAAHTLDW